MRNMTYQPVNEISYREWQQQKAAEAERSRRDALERERQKAVQAEYGRTAWPVVGLQRLLESNPRFQRRVEYDPSALDAALLRDYPCIRPDAIRLALAALGAATASQATNPPMILFTGENGGGKTSSVGLAANIACTEAPAVDLMKDVNVLLRWFGGAASSHQFLFLDELERVYQPRLSSHLPMLARGREYGEREITALAPVILACKTLHPVFWMDRALARRIVHVDLQRGAVGNDWSVNPVQQWRSKNVDVADGLISEVIDRLFREPRTWEQIVRELGFSFLTTHREQVVRDFAASLPVPSKASPVHGPGWRMIVPKRGSKEAGAAVAQFERLKQVLIDEGCAVVLPRSGERRTFICFPPAFSLEASGAGGGEKEGLTCGPVKT